MVKLKNYVRPATFIEARNAIQQSGAIALSGGAFAFTGIEIPYETVIDLQNIEDLKGIRTEDGALNIGCGTILQEIVDSTDIPSTLKATLTRALVPNHRNGASVGESLLFPSRAKEWITALIAVDAQIELVVSTDRIQPWSVYKFVTRNDNPQAILSQLTIPIDTLGSANVARTPTDDPIVNAAVSIRRDGEIITEAIAALSGASTALFAHYELPITDQPLNDDAIQTAVEHIKQNVNPVSDYKGSADYRREMAGVCVRRALQNIK